MNLPEAAIITIFYNRKDYVYESVESLISQTYENLKIILIDDCSTDATYEKLFEFEGKDRRLQISRNKVNKGFTQTLIDTIENLNVKYIAIHGAGDISLPSRVEEQVKYLEQNPDVGVVTVDITNLKKPKFHQTEITLKHLLKKNRITHGAVMYRLTDFKKAGGYRSFFTTRQDKDLWFRLSLITRINFFNKKLYSLTEIKSTVSKTAAKSGVPTLLSAFAEFLIKERINRGTDSLDEIGEKSALFFNPKNANRLFRRNLIRNLFSGNVIEAKNWLFVLKKTNSSSFYRLTYYLLEKFI